VHALGQVWILELGCGLNILRCSASQLPNTTLCCSEALPHSCLPGVLLSIVGAFHLALLAAGMSLQDAQEAGWVLKPAVREDSAQLGGT